MKPLLLAALGLVVALAAGCLTIDERRFDRPSYFQPTPQSVQCTPPTVFQRIIPAN